MAEVILNSDGVREVLNSPTLAAVILETAGQVAANADTRVPVTVKAFKTDRVGAGITLGSSNGEALEARDGILRKAAASLGLEVRDR